MKITRLDFNWFIGGSDGDLGEDYYVFEVGKTSYINNVKKVVVEILENKYMDGTLSYDVYFEDKTMQRIFNPNRAYYEKE